MVLTIKESIKLKLREGVSPFGTLIRKLGAKPVQGKPNMYVVSNGKSSLYFKKNSNNVEIDLIKTPENERGQGHGRDIMNIFFSVVDSIGMVTTLSVIPRDQKTDATKLKRFYSQYGFQFINEPEEDEFGDEVQNEFDFEMVRYPR